MSLQEKDQYFVAVKLLLRDGDKLLITKDIFKDGWDLPGGRIHKEEFGTPLPDVIERKVREELGPNIQYVVGEPVVFFRHEREEATADKERVRIFAIGYSAMYNGGEIVLGDHHEKYEWVDVVTFDPKPYFTGGWLRGVEEYLEKVRSV